VHSHFKHKVAIDKLLKRIKPGIVLNIYNPTTWEGKAGGLWVQGHLQLHSENLSQKGGGQGRGREM
jgi:hypothetical protein